MTLAAAGDVAAGLALLVAGVLAWVRVRDSGTGPLLLLAGTAWIAGDVSTSLVHAHRGPLVHALLTFPTGRTRSPWVVAVIVAAYLEGLLPAAADEPWTGLGLAAALVVAAGIRLLGPGTEPASGRVVLACATAVAAPLALASAGRLSGSTVGSPVTALYEGAVVLTSVALVGALVSGRSVTAAATGLVVTLAGHQEPRALRNALAGAVGDPGLAVAFRVDDPGGREEWVDEGGRPVRPSASARAGGRALTLVEDAGTPVAALTHDPTVLRDANLALSVSAAVRLVMANVRLQAEDAARTHEVSDSRRRLLETADEERRRIGEQLREGAERMLAEAAAELGSLTGPAGVPDTHTAGADVSVPGLLEELEGAAADLARFARGVHPLVLTEQGLGAALSDLAGRAAVPVTVHAPPGRFPAAQETAVFFVCSEALTNVAKYAAATRVSVEVTQAPGLLSVRVVDDGRGGADPERGTGLHGLRDRVEALGGRLDISSPPGGGTELVAAVPLPGAAAG